MPRMPAAKERDMSNEEQHKRVMAWAQDALNAKALYMESLTLDDTERKEIAAVLLAQEAELADQRVLLERWSEAWSSKDRRYPYPETRAHLDGSKKAGWSEVLGILNDGSTPRETLEEVTQKFIDDETERRAEADELEPLELNRRQCNASNSTVGGDPAGRLDLANAIFLNNMAHQIENRDAEIVAAIAEVRQEVKADRNCAINREQDQYSSLCKLMDKMQAQIVALREDLTGRIDMRCDERDEMQIQIDALTEAVLAVDDSMRVAAGFSVNGFNRYEADEAIEKLREGKKGESDGKV